MSPQDATSSQTPAAGDRIHVLSARRFSDAQLERLRAVSPRLVIRQHPADDSAALTRLLDADIEVLYASHAPTTLGGAPRLRWLQTHGAGMNHIMNTPVWDSDVLITNGSGINATGIGEHVLTLMLALTRRFPAMIALQRRTEWPPDAPARFPGHELRGATVAVVGYGSVGREVARLCHALGMRIVAVKRTPDVQADTGFALPGTGDPEGHLPTAFYGPGDLHSALAGADFVVLTAPSTAETRRLIDEAALRVMRPHAVLINVGRGDLVDQPVLTRALQQGRLGGAALDVTDPEPLPVDSPLWGMESVIVSPHVSGQTTRYHEYATVLFADNLRRYVNGEPLLNLVDRRRGY